MNNEGLTLISLQRDPILSPLNPMSLGLSQRVNKNIWLLPYLTGYPKVIHPYGYVGLSPVNWIDPLGLWYVDIGGNIPVFGPFGGISIDFQIGPCGTMIVPGVYIGTPGASGMVVTGNPTAGFQQSMSGGYWVGGSVTSYGQHGPYSFGGGFSTPGFGVEIFQYGIPITEDDNCKCKK